jgi:hypothetical protein
MHKDALRIDEPCQMDFDAMTRGDRSRFCGACKKHVHELTKLTESEARRLLATPSTEGLCVRYVYDDLGHVVFRDSFRDHPIPGSALVRAKRVLQTALVALPLSLTACMGAAQRPALMGEPAPYFGPDASAPDPAVSPAAGDASASPSTSVSHDAGAPKQPKTGEDEQSPKPAAPLPLAR